MASSQHKNVVTFPSCVQGALIPDGEYQVAFDRYHVTTRFGRGSLELWFRIMDLGEFFEAEVCRYYKVGREGKRSFRASPNSIFCREFAAVFGRRPPTGLDAVHWYRGQLYVAEVRVVSTDYRQRKLPDAARYNVVDRLISKAEI